MQTPLDAPESAPSRSPRSLSHQVFLGIEVVFIGLGLLGLLLARNGSWDALYLSLVGVWGLMLLYLLVPTLIFGSRGWAQHVGSHVVGFLLLFALELQVAGLHGISGWVEAACWLFAPILVVAGVVLYLLVQRPARWYEGHFYQHVVVRLLAALLLNAWTLYEWRGMW
jgi:hypothetical protein